MRHRSPKKILGREKAPREALLRNLAASLILYEKIKTTKAKAKIIRPIVEKLVTKSRANTLHARRLLLQYLYSENAVKKLMEVLGPKYKERKGGYTRIVSLGRRAGDAAEMVRIEFV